MKTRMRAFDPHAEVRRIVGGTDSFMAAARLTTVQMRVILELPIERARWNA